MQTRAIDRTRVSDGPKHCSFRVVRWRTLCSRPRPRREHLSGGVSTPLSFVPDTLLNLLMRSFLVTALAGALAVDALKVPIRKLSRPHTSRKRALSSRAAAADTLDLSCVHSMAHETCKWSNRISEPIMICFISQMCVPHSSPYTAALTYAISGYTGRPRCAACLDKLATQSEGVTEYLVQLDTGSSDLWVKGSSFPISNSTTTVGQAILLGAPHSRCAHLECST